MNIAERIKARRQELHISQAELAQRMRISASRVGQYEQGYRRPSAETIPALCRALECSSDWLLGIDA